MKWITCEQIRVNRMATCWLILHFLDKKAEFIFVPAADIQGELKVLTAASRVSIGLVILARLSQYG